MQFVILDLEWNGAFSRRRKKHINEIIEFGAIKVDEDLNVVDEFSLLVTPQVGKRISDSVMELTKLQIDELNESNTTFTQAVSRFRKFLGDAVLMTWGIGDILTLIENFKYYLVTDRLDFLSYYCNLQEYSEIELNLNNKSQLGLLNASELLQVDLGDLNVHRALDDSKLSLACLRKVYDKKKISDRIVEANDEFYKKINFKTSVISNLNNPLVDHSQLFVNCEICGRRAERKSAWEVKNKSFRAKYHCYTCNRDFIGRIIFKLKYEGLAISKKNLPIDLKTEESGK